MWEIMIEKKLNELNIFALRDLARKTGVSSPTSKKKDELIKGIVEIMSGEKKPDVPKSKQGRPPKVFGYDFMNVFNNGGNNLSTLTLNQQKVDYNNADLTTVAGWVELGNNNTAIMLLQKNFKNEFFFIPSEILQNYDLRMGDRIVSEVSVDENQRVVKSVFNVNGCPIKQLTNPRVEYHSVEHVLSNRKIKFKNADYSKLNLMIGENVYVYGTNNNNNTTVAIDMLNDCEIETKLYVNVSLAEKNKIYLSNLNNIESFTAHLTDDVDVARRIVLLAIERAKRALEAGEDVLFVVDDVCSIMGIDKENLNLVKNLVSIAKDGGEKGSITVVAVIPNDNIYQIEKLVDKRLRIENKNIFVIN